VSYLRYLCLLAHSGVQHILCCVFALFFFVLCTLCCQFIWSVSLWLPRRYYLTSTSSSTLIVKRLKSQINSMYLGVRRTKRNSQNMPQDHWVENVKNNLLRKDESDWIQTENVKNNLLRKDESDWIQTVFSWW
jgi:hypothetical protein